MKQLRTMIAVLALSSLSGPVLAETLHGTLYKDPHCDCCEAHADYLRKNGIAVDIEPVSNLAEMSTDAGVPAGFQGCHLIKLDGYVFEGHITSEIIKRFLTEKPSGIVGLTLPGMPTGVPGMDGPKRSTYPVYAVKKDGTTEIYAAQ
jgi:hypothetical protein